MPYSITDKCIGCGICKMVCPMEAIEGKRGKVHTIKSDLCIDCDACGKVCPQESVLDNQKNICKRIRFKKYWEKPRIIRKNCMSCTICIDSCPVDCIGWTFTKDTKDKRAYPVLENEKKCIACRFCAIECPVDAIEMVIPGG